MAATFHIDGLAEARTRILAIPWRVRNKSLRKAFNKGAAIAARAIRRNTPRLTGTAKASVRSKVMVRWGREPVAFSGWSRVKGGKRNPAKYAHLMERGSKAHVILPTKGKALKFWKTLTKRGGQKQGLDGRASVALYARAVRHPGAKAGRVVERSQRESESQVKTAIAETLRANLPKDVVSP